MRTNMLLGLGVLAACAAPAQGGSHLWRFNEVFSNEDGSIQFVELKECCGAGNETFLAKKWVLSDVNDHMFVFPENLPCTNCTAHRHLLLATPAFAVLPGAPTPDFVLPPEAFFAIEGDTLRYWLYPAAEWTFGPVPTDGVDAMQQDGSIAVNSPTNFDGETGSVVAPCHPADVNGNGAVDINDLTTVILAWGPNADHPADIDGDGLVGVDDLVTVLLAWGGCGNG